MNHATNPVVPMQSLWLPDEAATLECARRLAACMPAAAAPAVIHLHGDLGTGKTTLTRGMLRALGEPGPVRSPTYGLLAEYDTPQGRVVHLDLYRLKTPDELVTLGLADYLAGSRLWLVEWPERAAGVGLPAADLAVFIEVEGAGRQLRLVPQTDQGRLWVAAFSADQA
jgi:tRNA threonylcarbamoyl adenosine modification protein YjeE